MCLQDKETYGHRRVSLRKFFVASREKFLESDEISKALAHLLPVDRYHVIMHPVVHHFIALRCHGLGNLAFVVGEYQVEAASVNVEMLAKIFSAHCRTFSMPAREPVAPRRWPPHDMFGLRLLP